MELWLRLVVALIAMLFGAYNPDSLEFLMELIK